MRTFSGPEGGTSTIESIEKRQRSIKKETSTVKLQMELQRYASQEKRCCKRFFFTLIGKDIQKDFTKIYGNIRIIRIRFECFFRCLFPEKAGIIGFGTIQVPCNLRASQTCKVVKDFFSKANTWKEIIKRGQDAKRKRAKIGVHSFAGSFAGKALAV